MSLSISPETERLLRDAMARGGFVSEDETLRQALHSLASQQASNPSGSGSLFGSMAEYADDLDATVEQAMRDRGHSPSRAADAG